MTDLHADRVLGATVVFVLTVGHLSVVPVDRRTLSPEIAQLLADRVTGSEARLA